MKQVIISKDAESYINNIVKENNLTLVNGNDMSSEEVTNLLRSASLDFVKLLFVQQIHKSSIIKPYTDLLLSTKHNVIIVVEEKGKVPMML